MSQVSKPLPRRRPRGDFAADRRLLILTAIAMPIAALSTVVAYVLVQLISLATNIFYYGEWSFAARAPSLQFWGPWSVLVPVVGGLLIGLIARFGSDRIRGHGIPEALEVILFGKSLMKARVAILKPISSAIAIGSGGPFGAEGPIIMTGGAFGSLIAQAFHLSASERKTLLVAGAAAGMTAIFGTPLAAVLLAIEIMLFEMRPRSLVPVAVAAAMAYAMRPLFFEAGPLFPLSHLTVSWAAYAWAIPVGVVAGLAAYAINAMLYRLEDAYHRLPLHWMWWPALAGVVLGVVGMWQPRVLGVGYDVIGTFLQGKMAAEQAAPLVLAKALVWGVALGSGTSGGILAPMLMMGSGLGILEARVLPDAALWPVVSMSALMGGLMRAPLTAVAFAFEVTHAEAAMAPLLLATAVSYAMTVLVMKRSILTEKVARRGHHIFYEYEVDPLERVRVRDVMSAPVVCIPAETPVAQCQHLYFAPRQRHRGYPVVEAGGKVLGVLTAHDLLSLPGDAGQEALQSVMTARDLLQRAPLTILAEESCRGAAEKMARYGVGRLVVVGPGDELLGIVTRSDLLKPREAVVNEETTRERHLAWHPRVGHDVKGV